MPQQQCCISWLWLHFHSGLPSVNRRPNVILQSHGQQLLHARSPDLRVFLWFIRNFNVYSVFPRLSTCKFQIEILLLFQRWPTQCSPWSLPLESSQISYKLPCPRALKTISNSIVQTKTVTYEEDDFFPHRTKSEDCIMGVWIPFPGNVPFLPVLVRLGNRPILKKLT